MISIRRQLPVYSPVSAKAAFLASAQLLHLGEDPRPALAALLAKEYNATHVVLTGSGTQALTLAIQEAQRRVDPKAPVALPAFSCFDVASAAIGADVSVSLYDLDPDTLGPDLESLERVLRAGAGVVVAAPLYGMPIDWPSLVELAERYGAVLIEDAAQGHGASFDGKPLGSLGDISTLSFGRGKGWTGGSGGALLLRGSAGGAHGAIPEPGLRRSAATVVSLFAQQALARPSLYGFPASIPGLRLGQTIYMAPRRTESLTRSAAATLLATYTASHEEARARERNALRLIAATDGHSSVHPIHAQGPGKPGYLRLPVRLRERASRFPDKQAGADLGLMRSYPKSLSELPEIAGRLVSPASKESGARLLVRELVTLPTHSQLNLHTLEQIGTLLSDFDA